MPEQTFRIIYCSVSTVDRADQPAEVGRILETSRRNNAAADVTGALLHTDRLFAQTLEGPFDAVQAVFERIQADPRHDDVVILQAERVEGRLFTNWSMALVEPENPAHARDVLSRALIDRDALAANALLNLLTRVVQVPA